MNPRADADRLGMSSLTLFRRPRSMKEAAAMGLLPGALMIAFATGLKLDPHAGQVFVFRGKRGDLIKVLWHDGQGLCLFSKRLEKGRFVWPQASDGVVHLSPAQLGYLLEGIDWRLPQRTWRPEAAG
jgi:transposase